MKKIAIAVAAMVAAGAAMGAANDLLVTFSTPGPDKYADGSTVLDSETYALVWSKDLANFKIGTDGKGVGGTVVLKAPVARKGRCPTVLFEVDASLAEGAYSGGSWAVYLLDTRKFTRGADGSVLVRVGGAVNTVGAVGRADVSSGAGGIRGVAAATGEIAAGKDVPRPEITGMKVQDGYVYVTVKGTVPYLSYGLKAGATPDAVTEAAGEREPGEFDGEDEILLVAPATGNAGFFKVGN